MAVFTDTVTVYQKQATGYKRTVVNGCQWSEKIEKKLEGGKLQTVKTTTITFIEPFLLDLSTTLFTEEDGIFCGNVAETPTNDKGSRLSDMIKRYPKSGIIRAVNDNSNRDYLKNIKVVIY